MRSLKQVFDMKGELRDPEDGYDSSYHLLQNIPWTPFKQASKHTLVLNLKKLHMVSRVHVNDMNLGKCSLEVSEHKEGPYIEIAKRICVPHGKERIVKMGSVPCRFIRLCFEKKVPESGQKITVYGLEYGKIADRIEFGAEQYLFETPYRLVYGEK